MANYTYEDIIMDPEDPRLEGAIGKECYFSDYPKNLLNNARSNSSDICRLKSIDKEEDAPFIDGESDYGWTCIIIKKEEPQPRYVPFESMEEFVERYGEVRDFAEFNSFEDNLFQCGMWLKTYDNEKPTYRLVSRIEYKGVRISEHGFFTWEELLSRGFLFLNDTPCGRLKEA